jgi:hypothetical protein
MLPAPALLPLHDTGIGGDDTPVQAADEVAEEELVVVVTTAPPAPLADAVIVLVLTLVLVLDPPPAAPEVVLDVAVLAGTVGLHVVDVVAGDMRFATAYCAAP